MDRGLLAERGLELLGIEPGDGVCVQRAEPLLHLQRPRERHGYRHLLVEREADEKRQRLLREQLVCPSSSVK